MSGMEGSGIQHHKIMEEQELFKQMEEKNPKKKKRIGVEQQKAMEEHTVPKIRNIYFQK